MDGEESEICIDFVEEAPDGGDDSNDDDGDSVDIVTTFPCAVPEV